MSGFLIDGVPFVSEGDDIQGYLDSDHPGNVNEYTTTTNTGVTTPVPGLEEHNYNALKPNLPTRYKLRDVSLNENAFAYAKTFTRFQTGSIEVQPRFNRATIVIRGGKGGKGGGGGTASAWWYKDGSDIEQGKTTGVAGEGGPGGFGQIAVFTQEYNDQTNRWITINTIGTVGSSGSIGSNESGHTKADWSNRDREDDSGPIQSGAVNDGKAGNHTTVSILDNIIVAVGGNSGGSGNRANARSYGYWNGTTGNATSSHGSPGAPGNTPVSNTYVQDLHGGPDQWENVGDDGFVKIYFS